MKPHPTTQIWPTTGSRFFRVAMLAVLCLAFASRAGAVILYTNTTQTGFRYNPGNATANNAVVAFDDIQISNGTLGGGTALNVTRITVGIRQLAGAPATNVSVYWATFTTGSAVNGTELDSPGTLVGTMSLPGQAASVTSLVTFGDGISSLFTVPLNSTRFPGFGTFALGVELSNTDALNGWRLTSGPDTNADAFWNYDPSMAPPEAVFNFGGAPANPAATFYVVVEGSVIPEPGAIALFICGVLALVVFRMRRSEARLR